MKIDKTDIGPLHSELTIIIEKEDYKDKYKAKLNSTQAKSQLKGFRIGKAPISIIKKMYGTQLLQEIVSETLSTEMNTYLSDAEYNIIGQPLYLDEDNPPDIRGLSPEDYTYRFEIGIEPSFEIKGLENGADYTLHNVIISDKMVTEELEHIAKQRGTQESVDEPVEEEDIVVMEAVEMDGSQAKADGHKTNFSAAFNTLTDEYKDKFLGAKVGDKITFDIYQLEKNQSPENVRKYLMNLTEEQMESAESIGSTFEGTISDVKRRVSAEINQELFDAYFGKEAVVGEDEARERISKYQKEYYDQEARNFLSREIMESVIEKTEIELPEAFIKKWLKTDEAETPPNMESIAKELKWMMIKDKLVKKHEIKANEQEIINYFVNAIRSYSPYIDEATLKNTAFSLMKNREQVAKATDAVTSGKLFDVLQSELEAKEDEIELDAFLEKVKVIKEKSQEPNA